MQPRLQEQAQQPLRSGLLKQNEKTDTFSVDLKDESGKTTDGKIAPGSKGSFKIKVDGTGSEVALDYSAVFSNIQGKPSALKFYSDEYMTEIADLAAYKGIKGSIGATDADKVKEYTIYWQWPFNDASETVPETKAMSFDITVTGTQQAPKRPLRKFTTHFVCCVQTLNPGVSGPGQRAFTEMFFVEGRMGHG